MSDIPLLDPQSSSFTFKLCYGNEIRRFSVEQAPSFESLQNTATEFSGQSPLKLTWTDDDGDVITIRSQADLDEALSFLVKSRAGTLKLTIEPLGSAPPFSFATTARSDAEEGVVDINTGGPSSSSSSSSSYPRRPDQSQETRVVTVVVAAPVAPKLRRKLEKYNNDIKKEAGKCQAKLQQLRVSPFFDEKELLRQMQVLRDAEIPIYHFTEQLLAHKIVWNNQGPANRGWIYNWVSTWIMDIVDGKTQDQAQQQKVATLSEKTQAQLRALRENNMSCGWPVAALLDQMNKQLELASKDLEIQGQLAQLRDLEYLPEPLVVYLLKEHRDANRGKVEDECCGWGSWGGWGSWFWGWSWW